MDQAALRLSWGRGYAVLQAYEQALAAISEVVAVPQPAPTGLNGPDPQQPQALRVFEREGLEMRARCRHTYIFC